MSVTQWLKLSLDISAVNRLDIGLAWAKFLNTWGQLSAISGMLTTFMTAGIFYTTTINPNIHMPFWVYLTILGVGASGVCVFIITVGIKAYYKFLADQSDIHKVEKKLDAVIKHLGIKIDDEP